MFQLTPEIRKELVQKWSTVESKLNIGDLPESQKEEMAIMLESQSIGDGQVVISEATTNIGNIGGSTNGSADSDAYKFQPIALALVRRAMPQLFAHKCVGVQAMNAPVGLAYALRKVYGDNNADNIEAGWEQVDKWAGYTGSQRQTSGILSQEANGIYDTSATGANAVSAEAWDMDTTWPQLKAIVDKKTIEAVTRKIGTSFSIESAQDIQAMLGVDLEKEMVEFLMYEIIAELDRELIYRMKKAATDTTLGGEVISAINVSGAASLDGRWSQEKISQIVTAIIHQQNKVAYTTRLGAANVCVVSNAIATALQSAPASWFTKIDNKVNGTSVQATGVAEIGTLNGGTMTVYRDTYARTDYALVGYKGEGASKAGIIYSPYVTGLKKAIEPDDFSSKIGAYSRYAITDNLLGAGRFYRLLSFSNLGTLIPGA